MKMTSLAILAVMTLALNAEPIPTPGTQQVKPIFDASDLVALGITQSTSRPGADVESGGHEEGYVAHVRILATFKAAAKFPEVISVYSGRGGPSSQGKFYLLFLKRSPNGDFEREDPFLGSTEVDIMPTGNWRQGMAGLEEALAQLVSSQSRGDRIHALNLLQGFPDVTARTRSILEKECDDPDAETAMDSVAALIKFLPTRGLSTLDRMPFSGDRLQPNVLSQISSITERGAEPGLEELLGSESSAVRFAAIYAIRRMKLPTSAVALSRALDDPDIHVRYQAVIALAELNPNHGEYGPSIPTFEKDPSRYTSHWKQWWLDEGQHQYRSQ